MKGLDILELDESQHGVPPAVLVLAFEDVVGDDIVHVTAANTQDLKQW